MAPGRPLRSRLLLGLLGVTAVGLLVTCVVGFLTLRAFITERLDAQLVLTAERAMARLDNGTPPVGMDAPSPSPYFVVLLNPDTGEVNQIYGDTLREDVVLERIASIPLDELRGYGRDERIFELDGREPAVPPHRATVRLRADAVMVSGVPTEDRATYPWQLVLTQLITAGLLLAGLTWAGRWLIVRGLAPLDRMATTANQISTGSDLADRMPDAEPYSEVGRLGMAINTMLGRIEQSFRAQRASEERVREFAADASHELRTPLTTIRGYAELYRQGAIPPEELPEAMRRIENEAERMSRLVAELLELARLDRTGSLQLGTGDLALMVRDMVADARALEPERPITLAIPDGLAAEVDETRFRQVLANLLGNVREHTPKQTPVQVRLAAADGMAVLEVADEGPGMAAEDVRRAFDRFYRGTREPGGGSGLGLAIVQAIATAHGGDVLLTSRPRDGVRVRVRIPLRAAPP
ncbi:sensor histidine kinase [Marinitenerispora sediminis]|uniref:histidine kinase n=1 Tax=Marinitenerispora sediminis TaxID=1931232 RepID=A0A368SZ47_9ACTN|nr:HAMP domain-containing sensor histidine kinase [Marinitenerispora sediminis]RCV47991.1 two-component sensor histidine kinase [Marinitenerispora sediminis]RCV48998.1 two-component sensor histidine kinase [Marinitenerispora sediminis]RCV50585.1 two-component sensor histidine kinase [Marinitenerispora sediminis]